MGDSSLEPALHLFGILVAVLVGATFAGLAAGIAALGTPELLAAQEQGGATGAAAARLLGSRERIEARLLAGRILCLSTAAVLTSDLVIDVAGVSVGLVAAFGIAFVYGLVAEISTTLVRDRARTLTLRLLRWVRPLELLVLPLAAPLAWLAARVGRAFPAPPAAIPERAVALGVEEVIERGEESGTISEEQAELLRSALEFKDIVAKEVMVPRTRMVAVDVAAGIAQTLKLVLDEGHSRYPVYRESVDHVEGVLFAKDLFRAVQEKGTAGVDLAQIVRKPPFFAVETQKVSTLLREMQQKRVHLAVVLDEFGGTSGIVTLEDILEQIVGDIRDEHDVEETRLQELGPGHYLADAGVAVSDLEELLGSALPEDRSSDSIGGMIMELAGKVPSAGESVRIGAFDLIVREAEPRRIKRVEIRRRPAEEPAATG